MVKNTRKEKSARELFIKEVEEEKANKGWKYNRNLLETSIDSLIAIGPDGIILDVNSATEKATGLPRERIIGTDFSEYFTEPEKARDGYKRVFNIGKVVDYELYLKHVNGSSIPVLYSASVYKDYEDHIIGVLAAARDISAIKKNEDELTALKNNLELIVQQKIAELIIANKELAFLNEEQEKRAVELLIADKELVFQNDEKEKRAAELLIANKELAFQNDEKEKRAAELLIANKELAFQNDEKEKRAAELLIANKELIFQNDEKGKRAAELLIVNKNLLESQRIAHIGTWRLDIETNQVVWSEELYKMYGFDPSIPPPTYTEHMKLFTPESWKELSTAIENTRTSGIPYELELETVKADRSNGWMWVRGEANSDSGGNIVSLLGAAQDISQRKRDEAELKYERNMAQMYLEIAGVMIIALDKNGRISLINREGCEILKVKKEDILGKIWIDSFVPDSARKDIKQVFDKIISGDIENMENNELSVVTANRDQRILFWHNSVLRDTAGNIIGVLGSGTDVTEHKQAAVKMAHLASFPRFNPDPIIELTQDGSLNYANPVAMRIFPDLMSAGTRHPFLLNWQTAVTQLSAQEKNQLVREIMVCDCIYSQTFQYIESSKTIRIYSQNITSRKQAEKALAESENLFRTSFESAIVGIAMLGKNGMFIKVNDRACELWGYTRDELLQLHFNDITYEEDQGIGADIVNKMISGEVNNAVFEKRYVKKDGTIIWALISTSAIRDESNNLEYYINYIQDITNSKEFVERISDVLEGTIETLALVVEARDPYTSGHQKRVAEIAVAIAENLGLSKGQVRGLYLASIVHDLGKIQVPSEILSKPGKLTDLEFELIKCHPETAYNLLKDIDFPWPIAEIVYQHHERIDGSGYPRKLKGDSILIESKILGVADVFEAMSSHRPYRAAFPIETALAEIEKNKGVLYDPDVVEACLKVLKNS